MRIVTHHDEDFGVVAAAVNEDGEIVATASASHADGVYMAVDEAAFYEATGELLPADLWDEARDA